jgi:hypothetical protein
LYSENKFIKEKKKIVPAIYKFNSNTVTYKDQVYIIECFEQHNQNKVFATLRSVGGIQNEVDVAHLKVVILFKGQAIDPKFLAK